MWCFFKCFHGWTVAPEVWSGVYHPDRIEIYVAPIYILLGSCISCSKPKLQLCSICGLVYPSAGLGSASAGGFNQAFRSGWVSDQPPLHEELLMCRFGGSKLLSVFFSSIFVFAYKVNGDQLAGHAVITKNIKAG